MVDWSSNIQIHPWIGCNYQAGVNFCYRPLKILLIGESHNLDRSDDRNQGATFTQDSIENYLALPNSAERRWRPASYWTKLGKVIAGPDHYDSHIFWRSIAFYNYLQFFKRVNNHPSDDEYNSSREALNEVKNSLDPDGIIVLCKRLWPHVSDIVGGQGFWINHPSRIKYDEWHPKIMRELENLKRKAS